MANVKTIPRMELHALLDAYNEYIQDANEENKYEDGWKPVCINEFYDNEWLEILRNEWIGKLHRDERRALNYIEHHAVICPVCESKNINALGYEGEGLYQQVECHDCGSSWNDLHEIIDAEIIEDGDR